MTDVSTPHLRHTQQQFLVRGFIRKYFRSSFDEEIEQALRLGDLVAILFAILQRLFHRLPDEIREPIGFGAVDKLAGFVKDLSLAIPGVKHGVCFRGQAQERVVSRSMYPLRTAAGISEHVIHQMAVEENIQVDRIAQAIALADLERSISKRLESLGF